MTLANPELDLLDLKRKKQGLPPMFSKPSDSIVPPVIAPSLQTPSPSPAPAGLASAKPTGTLPGTQPTVNATPAPMPAGLATAVPISPVTPSGNSQIDQPDTGIGSKGWAEKNLATGTGVAFATDPRTGQRASGSVTSNVATPFDFAENSKLRTLGAEQNINTPQPSGLLSAEKGKGVLVLPGARASYDEKLRQTGINMGVGGLNLAKTDSEKKAMLNAKLSLTRDTATRKQLQQQISDIDVREQQARGLASAEVGWKRQSDERTADRNAMLEGKRITAGGLKSAQEAAHANDLAVAQAKQKDQPVQIFPERYDKDGNIIETSKWRWNQQTQKLEDVGPQALPPLSADEEALRLERKIHTNKIADSDNRYGFFNFRDRVEAIRKIDKKLEELKNNPSQQVKPGIAGQPVQMNPAPVVTPAAPGPITTTPTTEDISKKVVGAVSQRGKESVVQQLMKQHPNSNREQVLAYLAKLGI